MAALQLLLNQAKFAAIIQLVLIVVAVETFYLQDVELTLKYVKAPAVPSDDVTVSVSDVLTSE